mmetsp:Transcript_59810/g.129576  ORF Transcript_59810/g.129576 Transcript_59810/m.129576 type:complete len:366 (-) Transcript_59810:531-1628(-)
MKWEIEVALGASGNAVLEPPRYTELRGIQPETRPVFARNGQEVLLCCSFWAAVLVFLGERNALGGDRRLRSGILLEFEGGVILAEERNPEKPGLPQMRVQVKDHEEGHAIVTEAAEIPVVPTVVVKNILILGDRVCFRSIGHRPQVSAATLNKRLEVRHEALQFRIHLPQVAVNFPDVGIRGQCDLLAPNGELEVGKLTKLCAVAADVTPAVERSLNLRHGTAWHHNQRGARVEDGVALGPGVTAQGGGLSKLAAGKCTQRHVAQRSGPIKIIFGGDGFEHALWLALRQRVVPDEVTSAAKLLAQANREGLQIEVLCQALCLLGVLEDSFIVRHDILTLGGITIADLLHGHHLPRLLQVASGELD